MNRSVLEGVESMAFQLLGSRFTIELRSGGLFSLLAWCTEKQQIVTDVVSSRLEQAFSAISLAAKDAAKIIILFSIIFFLPPYAEAGIRTRISRFAPTRDLLKVAQPTELPHHTGSSKLITFEIIKSTISSK